MSDDGRPKLSPEANSQNNALWSSSLPLDHDCGTLKCENSDICEKRAKCEKHSTLNVKIDAICEKNNAKCEKMRLSKCIKHVDSKCVKIDAICANFTYGVNLHI